MVKPVGVILLLYVLVTALAIEPHLMHPAYLLVPFFPTLYRFISSTLAGQWFTAMCFYLEYICGVKYVITGDSVSPTESSLIISNHRCRLDWFYLFPYFIRTRKITNVKIVLKAPLRHIPFIGWGCQLIMFMFVKRKWEDDMVYIRKVCLQYARTQFPLSLLIFPEGTDLSPNNLERSKEFSRQKGLPEYDYVLHPRTRGFVEMARELERENRLDAIYDVTIAYTGYVPQFETSLVMGKYPKEVHVHVKRYLLKDIPVEEKAREEWVKQRFAEKEVMLKDFFENKKESLSPQRVPFSRFSVATLYLVAVAFVLLSTFFYFRIMYTYTLYTCLVSGVSLAILVLITNVCEGYDSLELKLCKVPDPHATHSHQPKKEQ